MTQSGAIAPSARAHQDTTGRAYGLPKLVEVFGEKTAVKAAEWLGYSEQAAESETEPHGRGAHVSARARKSNRSWDEPDFSLLHERRGFLPYLSLGGEALSIFERLRLHVHNDGRRLTEKSATGGAKSRRIRCVSQGRSRCSSGP